MFARGKVRASAVFAAVTYRHCGRLEEDRLLKGLLWRQRDVATWSRTSTPQPHLICYLAPTGLAAQLCSAHTAASCWSKGGLSNPCAAS